MNRTQRIAAAKERMLSRYPDRDTQEAKRMESFRGLSKEDLKRRFEEAAHQRGIQLKSDKEERERVDLES
ncbi:hypothetical protein [Vibrio parahaemolyticus]|uniref:hypothetical protein n=1 Tax=Vibrio parahaemolyticus TaxID=670 RepID=UPI00084ADF47|nr:hypothetical protein [Vibrio parahaemolyticus]ODY11639.1 hypothetical protein BBM17_18710 [Vibrio parahaemolyticus]